MNFQEKDLNLFNNKGISADSVEHQLNVISAGANYADLVEPATIENGGILSFPDKKINSLAKSFDLRKNDFSLSKFIPASGAASRMFKNLFLLKNHLDSGKSITPDDDLYPVFNEFLKGLPDFPFFEKIKSYVDNAEQLLAEKQLLPLLNAIVDKDKLNYPAKPKAFIDFHKYDSFSRNAFQEQVYEYLFFGADENNELNVHLTISKEHEAELKAEYEILKKDLLENQGVTLNLTWSFQSPSTDTVSLGVDNQIFRDEKGDVFFRPGGHGALLNNLNDLEGEIIFVKNIDNVVHQSNVDDTILYKKALAAYLMDIVETVHGNLELLYDANIVEDELEDMFVFAKEKLGVRVPSYVDGFDFMEKVDYLYTLFNRPLRVCGMVKNEGEPGGGPFYVRDSSGNVSLQIVESAEVDFKDDKQSAIFKSSTHFNPVDLICYVRDFDGDSFDLTEFSNPDACFVSRKSYNGEEIKVLELPGLWNGAMFDWITIFVEVPLSTFNPVKEVIDLLRPAHCAKK